VKLVGPTPSFGRNLTYRLGVDKMESVDVWEILRLSSYG